MFEDEAVVDYGMGFLTPAGVEPAIIPRPDGTFANYGDWLNLGIVTRATHDAIGTDFCQGDADCSPAGQQDAVEAAFGAGTQYAAAIAVDVGPDAQTGATLLGLDAVTEPTGAQSEFLYAGTLNRDEAVNTYEDPVDINGPYFGQAGFVLTRQ